MMTKEHAQARASCTENEVKIAIIEEWIANGEPTTYDGVPIIYPPRPVFRPDDTAAPHGRKAR